MRNKLPALVLVVFLLTGCATLPSELPGASLLRFERERTYDFEFDRVWATIIELMTDMECPIESVDKASGLITTNFVTFTQSFLQSESVNILVTNPGFGVWDSARYKLNIFISSPELTRTRIKVRAHIEAYSDTFHRQQALQSNGLKESVMLNRIGLLLKGESQGVIGISKYRATKKGIMVLDVMEGSPADGAGVSKRDIISEVDGKPVVTIQQFYNVISGLVAGKEISLTLIQNREERILRIKLVSKKSVYNPGR